VSRPEPPRVYAIADAGVLAPGTLPAAVAEMASAGIRWIQVRAKGFAGGTLLTQLEACRRVLESSEVDLWIDDRVDLAALLPVFGVHLGQEDLPPREARAILGGEKWIGLSTHSESQVAEAEAEEAVDLVAFGPVFATKSKERPDPMVGLPGLTAARRLTVKPLVAIGGLDAGNLGEALAAGADAVAVLSAACREPVAESCRRLLAAAEGR
jgi:thiamine-phosphate pyrophosphorylase